MNGKRAGLKSFACLGIRQSNGLALPRITPCFPRSRHLSIKVPVGSLFWPIRSWNPKRRKGRTGKSFALNEVKKKEQFSKVPKSPSGRRYTQWTEVNGEKRKLSGRRTGWKEQIWPFRRAQKKSKGQWEWERLTSLSTFEIRYRALDLELILFFFLERNDEEKKCKSSREFHALDSRKVFSDWKWILNEDTMISGKWLMLFKIVTTLSFREGFFLVQGRCSHLKKDGKGEESF